MIPDYACSNCGHVYMSGKKKYSDCNNCGNRLRKVESTRASSGSGIAPAIVLFYLEETPTNKLKQRNKG